MQLSSVEEAKHRLSKTLVLWRDEPVWMHSINNDGMCLGKVAPLANGSIRSFMYNDPALDITSASSKLGYMEVGVKTLSMDKTLKTSMFLQRTGARKYLQGLYRENVLCRLLTPTHPSLAGIPYLGFEHILTDENSKFQDMFNNNYARQSTLGSVFSDPDVLSIPIHKLFAVRRDSVGPFYLTYKGKDIGWSDSPDNRFHLSPQFQFMEETLDHNRIQYRR